MSSTNHFTFPEVAVRKPFVASYQFKHSRLSVCTQDTIAGLEQKKRKTRFDVYETLCPQQMLVHKGGQIKNWSGECKDIIPTKLQCQTIQRTLQSPNLQREIIQKK